MITCLYTESQDGVKLRNEKNMTNITDSLSAIQYLDEAILAGHSQLTTNEKDEYLLERKEIVDDLKSSLTDISMTDFGACNNKVQELLIKIEIANQEQHAVMKTIAEISKTMGPDHINEELTEKYMSLQNDLNRYYYSLNYLINFYFTALLLGMLLN